MNPLEGRAGPERRSRPRDAGMEGALHPLFRLLRWIDGKVRGFHAAVGVFLLVGLATLAAALFVFAGLAKLMEMGLTQRADDAVLIWLDARATPGLTTAALEVTSLGAGAVVWMTLCISSAFLWTAKHRYSVLLLWVAMLGGTVLNLLLKNSFDRPRPHLFPWRTPQAGFSSFPSGHAMTSVVLYATLAYLLARLGPTRALRRLTLGVALLVILLVGLSRLYLGVHYPSDVLAGFVVGLAWATFCALGVEALRYFRTKKPGPKLEEKGLETGTEPIRDAVSPHPDAPPDGTR